MSNDKEAGAMLIDCDGCPVRGQHCAGCMVSVLFGAAPSLPDGDDECRALEVLAGAGFEMTVLARDERRLRLVSAPRRRRHAA